MFEKFKKKKCSRLSLSSTLYKPDFYKVGPFSISPEFSCSAQSKNLRLSRTPDKYDHSLTRTSFLSPFSKILRLTRAFTQKSKIRALNHSKIEKYPCVRSLEFCYFHLDKVLCYKDKNLKVTSCKRNLKTRTITQKYKILTEVAKGESSASISKKYGIAKQTLSRTEKKIIRKSTKTKILCKELGCESSLIRIWTKHAIYGF